MRAWIGVVLVGVLAAGCGSDDGGGDDDGRTGSLAGQVRIGGLVADATVRITQLSIDDTSGSVIAELGTTTTDATGHYQLDVGDRNGLFLVAASGGSYVEPESGETIALDATSAVRTLHHLALYESRTDALVSPIGHLTEAMARGYLADGRATNLDEALGTVSAHLNTHFGNVDWEHAAPADLSIPAASPTEPVRAAFVLGAWPLLAEAIAARAEASRQEVNSYALMVQWAADLEAGPFDAPTVADAPGAFDGNNGNACDGGLEVGSCPANDGDATSGCAIDDCATLCDLYANTARSIFGGQVISLVRSPRNGTGIDAADAEAIGNAISDNTDELLFGTVCHGSLDQQDPLITWDEPPAPGAYVRATITVRITASDDTDVTPLAAFVDYDDTDGDVANDVAVAMIDTSTITVGPLTVVATATDTAGNMATSMRMFNVDNVAPTIGVSDDGFYVDSAQWWTADTTPAITGTVTDDSPVSVTAVVGATTIATATVTGTTWSLALPADTVAAAGTDVTFIATDAAGNTAQVIQRLRVDAGPPALTVLSSPIKNETNDDVEFVVESHNNHVEHTHLGSNVALDNGIDDACPAVSKYIHLLVPAPTYVDEIGGAAADGGNPIRYNLTGSDSGVGVDLAASQYRVIRHADAAVVKDWAAMPTGTTVGSTTTYALDLDSEAIPSLGTTDGRYDVDLRIRDRLGQTTTTTRCWTHTILAPPLRTTGDSAEALGIHWASSTGGTMSKLGLTSTTLAVAGTGQSDAVAARFMSEDSQGAALIELVAENWTAFPVHLTVERTTDDTYFTYRKSYILGSAITSTTAGGSTNCPGETSGNCARPSTAVSYHYVGPTSDASTLSTVQRAYLVSDDTFTEIAACTAADGCTNTETVKEFVLPARTALATTPRYLIATMTGPLTQLQPTDPTHTTTSSFSDVLVQGKRIAGFTYGSTSTGCIETTEVIVGENEYTRCATKATVQPYRAATYLQLTTTTDLVMQFSRAASATLSQQSEGTGTLPIATTWTTQESVSSLPESYNLPAVP